MDDLERLDKWTQSNIDIIKQHVTEKVIPGAGSTDANIPLSLGLLANTIGTVRGGKAHTRQEWVDLTSLKDGMALAIHLMQRYL